MQRSYEQAPPQQSHRARVQQPAQIQPEQPLGLQIPPTTPPPRYALYKHELQQRILAITSLEHALVTICHKAVFLSVWYIQAMSSTGAMINPIAVEIHNFAMQTIQAMGEADNGHLLDILEHMPRTLNSTWGLTNILCQRQKDLESTAIKLQWAEPHLHAFWMHLHQTQRSLAQEAQL